MLCAQLFFCDMDWPRKVFRTFSRSWGCVAEFDVATQPSCHCIYWRDSGKSGVSIAWLKLHAVACRGKGVLDVAPGIHQPSIWRWASSHKLVLKYNYWWGRGCIVKELHVSWSRTSTRLCTPLTPFQDL